MKESLFFPKLSFNNAKSIEKQKSYGARSAEYFFMITNYHHDFEYFESVKLTSYCQFEFSSFPFDAHNCEILVGSGVNYIGTQKIKKPTVIHKKFASNKNSIPIKSKNVPFEMKAESITPFPHLNNGNGYNYSYTGVRISMKRNTLGLLLGRFYGPTAVFSALSLLSYNINMDMVL